MSRSNRKVTPDVMGRLMNEPTIKQESKKAINTAPHIAIKQESNKHDLENIKEKATFNLPVKLVEKLEDTWTAIRKIANSRQISKTLIVTVALEAALEEFDEKGESSQLYGNLASNKETIK